MNILLYDVDSVMPNIALMKLSTYHKNKGDIIHFFKSKGKFIDIEYTNYDQGYASVIFTKNKRLVDNFPFEIGGTGVDLYKTLDDKIEHLMPDYSLYPENKYSIGFLTRGCCNNCSFCVVPKKEGAIRFNAHVDEFLNPNLDKIRILDNNLLAYKNWEKCLLELKETDKKIKFENFDFRLFTEKHARIISKMKVDGDYIFALDDPKLIETFRKKMWLIEKYFSYTWRVKFYVMIGYNTTLKEDMQRIKFLYSYKVLPYIMRHENYRNSPYKNFYIDLAAFCNQPFFFKKMDFQHFMEVRYKKDHPRIKQNAEIFKDLWENA